MKEIKNGNLRIYKAQPPILGGLAAHNAIVVLDHNNNIILENELMKLLKVQYIMFLKEKCQYLCCLILAATLSACPVLKFNVDDQLGSKNSVGRIAKSMLITDPIDDPEYRKIKFQQVAERIINICTEQGLHNLKNPIQFRQCLELVDMKCDKNDVCRYDGYTKTENENGGTWNRIEYSISIDIKKGWTSLNIEAEWKRNYTNSKRKQPAPDGAS